MEAAEEAAARPARSLRVEVRALLRLAGPVVLAQVGLLAMGMVDTLVVGHLSAQALAAVALGSLYSFASCAFGMGALMALDPLVSQAHGAGDREAISRALARGLALALVLSVPSALVLLAARPVLLALHQPAELVPIAAAFAHISIGGVPAFLGFLVVRQSLQSMQRVRAIVAAVLIANVANLALDVALVFGRFGAPALGAVGSAWSTMTCRWLLVALLVAFSWRDLRALDLRTGMRTVDARSLRRLLRLGAPIGGQQLLEMGTFSAVALFMGWLGTTEVASHQVAIVLASMTFMLPLGISQAAAARVGHAIGRGDMDGARLAARAALLCGSGVMLLCTAAFLSVPHLLARAFSADEGVVTLAAALLRIAGVFQLFDGLQVVAIGILRGIGDTRTAFVVNVLGFVLVGIPTALILGFTLHLGARGLWWGLVAGLVVVAAILLTRVRARFEADVARMEH
jgi:MATE family multidrug resistance protein